MTPQLSMLMPGILCASPTPRTGRARNDLVFFILLPFTLATWRNEFEMQGPGLTASKFAAPVLFSGTMDPSGARPLMSAHIDARQQMSIARVGTQHLLWLLFEGRLCVATA